MDKKLVIAIDGFSSCGKSTVAKELAKQLGYTYIDSGAMYRAVTLYCIENGLIDDDGTVNEPVLEVVVSTIKIGFTYDADARVYKTWLNGQLVEDKIRTIGVSNKVSYVSKIGFVREQMVELQRQMGAEGGIVMDGRDIGTVVFPNADLKIFMTASVKVRAQRRYDELQAKGDNVTFDEVAANIEQRDYLDQHRDISPLRQADDAVVVDNSNLTREQQLTEIVRLVEQRQK